MALTATWEISVLGVDSFNMDITSDVISANITGRGILNPSPLTLLAQPGRLELYLDNSSNNSQSTEGYYRPEITTQFKIYNCIRITLTDGTYTKRYRFYIDEITPIAGKHGARVTRVTGKDVMHRKHTQNIGLLVGLELVKNIPDHVNSLLGQGLDPKNEEFQAGLEEYTGVGYKAKMDKTRVSEGIIHALKSDFGRCMVVADATYGETVKYFNRAHFGGILDGNQDVTFNENMSGLEIGYSGEYFHGSVIIETKPPEYGTAGTVIWDMPYEMELPPAYQYNFIANYTDQDQGRELMAYDIITPAATTDYTMGSGPGLTDKTADLSIDFAFLGSTSADITIRNTGSKTGYLTKFQIRGTPIFFNNPFTRTSAISLGRTGGSSGADEVIYKAPYWSSSHHIDTLGERIGEEFGYKQVARFLDFFPTKNATLLEAFLRNDMGAYTKVIETIKDYDPNATDLFYLIGEDVHFMGNNHLFVRWYLDGAIENPYHVTDGNGNTVVDENGNPIYGEEGIWW